MLKAIRFGWFFAALLALSAPAIADTYSRDSGPVFSQATPANAQHNAGTVLGCQSASSYCSTGTQSGLLILPVAGAPGGDGVAYHLFYKSVGGSTGQIVIRLWSVLPVNTTCQDNVAFSGSDTDDKYLISPPTLTTVTPAAPASTTGDSATYADLSNLTIGYKNFDGTPTQNIYACIVTVANDTSDENKIIRLTATATQNQH